ncbi:MAG: multidrug effflux MFS transporter [Parachlamydiales bacterium]
MNPSLLFPIWLILYEACANMSNDMYLPALPAIGKELGTTINLVQLTITVWLAGNAAVQLLVGPLADRYGRRPVLFLGGALFVLSTLGCALAPTITVLILSRFLQGVGVCTLMVAGYASVHDLYTDQQAIPILAWMGAAAVVSPAVGPAIGGLILTFVSWRSIFYLLAAVALISLIALWRVMPESTQERHSLDLPRLLRSYRNILTSGPFVLSGLAFGLLFGGMLGWITASPFLLITGLGLTPLQFGALQIPVFGAYIVGAALVKPLMKRVGKEGLIAFGVLFATLSALSMIIALFFPSHFLSLVLPMSGYALGFGFASAPLNRTTLTATEEPRGAAVAVFYLGMAGSATLISLILSLIHEGLLSFSLVTAAVALLALLLNFSRLRLNTAK